MPPMPNGKPGDHPVTDITVHRTEVFGAVCDDLIRDIHRHGGHKTLDDEELARLDPRFGGRPDLLALEAELRRVLDQLTE
jgi:hypothetical protein